MLQGPGDRDGSPEPALQLPPGCDRRRLPEVQVRSSSPVVHIADECNHTAPPAIAQQTHVLQHDP